jgi:hypothetical protein
LKEKRDLVKPAGLVKVCQPLEALMVMKSDAEETAKGLFEERQAFHLDHSARQTFARSYSFVLYLNRETT